MIIAYAQEKNPPCLPFKFHLWIVEVHPKIRNSVVSKNFGKFDPDVILESYALSATK